MRRVLYIVDSLNRGGAASQSCVLADGLARQGFDVQIATLDALRGCAARRDKSAAASPDRAIAPINSLSRRSALDPIAFVRLKRLIRTFQPDVVHAWNLAAGVYGSAALVGRSARPKLVVSFDRIQPWTLSQQWFIARRLLQRADQWVTSSAAVRDWYAGRGLSAERFSVIPPGVPSSRSSDLSREQLLDKLQLPRDARLIGVVERLVPENRVKDLIWAADLLRVLHDNLRLLVIGDGPLRAQLEEYALLASDLDHIRFLGARCDAWRIMPHLDVLWSASENLGPSASILAAMAAGVPVVASNTPTNRELVVENETGFLIPLGTRSGRAARARNTDRLISDAELADRLSAATRKRAEEAFGFTKCLQNYEELYAKMC